MDSQFSSIFIQRYEFAFFQTFQTCDTDRTGQLNLRQYVQAWKLLGQTGTDVDAKMAFDRTDIDASGFIEWSEFSFSILGDDATNYGLLADLDFGYYAQND